MVLFLEFQQAHLIRFQIFRRLCSASHLDISFWSDMSIEIHESKWSADSEENNL